jgi:type III pantothenate kinase
MNLLFDLCNTRLKCARWNAGALHDVNAIAHAGAGFEPALQEWLARVDASSADRAWIAAVAPDGVIARLQAVLQTHGVAQERVWPRAEALGVRLAYEQPLSLGVDRWLGLLAAGRSPGASLVVSVGSALAIDALAPQGRHLGGLIAPPPEAMRSALLARAPRLEVPGGAISRFAASTPDAIASGCLLAAVALIERSLDELAQRADATPRLLLCGGGAEPLRPWLPKHDYDPGLVLRGLGHWVANQDRVATTPQS